jgi:hypothetical protein
MIIIIAVVVIIHTWSTAIQFVVSTIVRFLIVDDAVTPTNVFPAPHGSTMVPYWGYIWV